MKRKVWVLTALLCAVVCLFAGLAMAEDGPAIDTNRVFVEMWPDGSGNVGLFQPIHFAICGGYESDELDENGNPIWISAEEAELLFFENGGGEGRDSRRMPLDENGYAEADWNIYWERGCTGYAMVRFGGEWVRTEAFSFTVDEPGEIQGEITVANAEELPAMLHRDECLTVMVNPLEHVDYFGVALRDPENPDWDGANSYWMEANGEGQTEVLVPLYRCEVGKTYDIIPYAIQIGCYYAEAEPVGRLKVARGVSDSGLLLANPADGATYQVGEPLKILASYEADEGIDDTWLWVYITRDGEDEIIFDQSEGAYSNAENEYTGSEIRNWDYGIWTAGSYTLTASLMQNVWDEDTVCLASESRRFTVTSEGAMELAYAPEMPDYLPVTGDGDEFHLTLPQPGAPAESWVMEVRARHDEGEYSCARLESGWGEDTMSFHTFDGHWYLVQVWAYQDNHDEFYWESGWIPAVNVTVNAENPEVVVGIEDGPLQYTNEDFRAVVDAPGAEWIRVFDTCSGSGGFEYRDNFGEEGAHQEFDRRTGMEETYRIWATAGFYNDDPALSEEERWTEITSAPLVFGPLGNTGLDMSDPSIAYVNFEGTDRTVARGEAVQVVLGESSAKNGDIVDEAVDYWLDIWCGEDEDAHGWDCDPYMEWLDKENRVAVVYTAGLPEGAYRLVGWAGRPAYGDGESEALLLRVTEAAQAQPAVTVEVSTTTPVTSEQVYFSVYAPGADWVDVYTNYPNWEEDTRYVDGSYGFHGYSRGYPGTYMLAAQAWYPVTDANGDPEWERDESGNVQHDEYGHPIQVHTPVLSDLVEVTFTAPKGSLSLALPETEIPEYLEYTWAEHTPEGNALDFTVPIPEHAESVYAEVRVQNEDRGWWDDPLVDAYWDADSEDDAPHIDISYADLQTWDIHPGQSLRINVYASARGYEESIAQQTIPVLVSNPDGSEASVLLTEKDKDAIPEAPITLRLNQNLDLRLTATGFAPEDDEEEDGVRRIRRIRIFGGYDFWDERDIDNWDENEHSFSVSFGDPGTYTVYAQATYDDWDDSWQENQRTWITTNRITVNVEPGDSKVGDFGISLDKETYERGEMVRVTFTASENAENYWLEGDFGPEWCWLDETNRVMAFPTVHLGPGVYAVNGGANTAGMRSNYSRAVIFEVTEPSEASLEDGIFYALSADTVVLEESLLVSIYAPGADQVGFIVDGEPWHLDENGNYAWGDGEPVESWYSGEEIRWNDGRDVGSHSLKAAVHYPGEYVWHELEKTVTVKSLGQLELDLSGLPVTLKAGSAAEITIPMPAHAEDMHVRVLAVKQQEPTEHSGELKEQQIAEYDQRTGALHITLPGSWLDPDAYDAIELHIDASAFGYEGAWKQVRIPIIPESAGSGATISLREWDEDGTWHTVDGSSAVMDAHFEIVVIPAEGKTLAAVRFYDGGGYWADGGEITPANQPDWFDWDDNGCPTDFALGLRMDEPGTYPIYAMVRMEGEDTWSATNVLQMEISAMGQVGDFDLATAQTTIEQYAERGTFLNLAFLPPEEYTPFDGYSVPVSGGYYWLDVFDSDGRYMEPRDQNTSIFNGYDPETGAIWVQLNTSWLEAGEYRVHGRSSFEGWIPGESRQDFILHLGDPDEPVLTLAYDEIPISCALEATFLAPGASRIWIQMDDDMQDFDPADPNAGWEGDSWIEDGNWRIHDAGSHKIVGWSLYVDEENGNPETNWYWQQTEPQYFRVFANGQLGSFDESGIPSIQPEDRGFGFSLARPEGAQWMHVQVRLIKAGQTEHPGETYTLTETDAIWGDGFGWGFSGEEEFQRFFNQDGSLDGVYIEAGDILDITYQAYAEGLEPTMSGRRVHVVDAMPDDWDSVLLFIGHTDDEGNWINEEDWGNLATSTGYSVMVHVDVSENQTAIARLNVDGEWFRQQDEDAFILDENGNWVFEDIIFAPDPCQVNLYAEVTLEEETTSETTKLVSALFELHLVSDGDATLPEGVNEIWIPDTVLYGEEHMPSICVPQAVDEDGWCNLFIDGWDGTEGGWSLFGVSWNGPEEVMIGEYVWDNQGNLEAVNPLPAGTYRILLHYLTPGRRTAYRTWYMKVVDPYVSLTTSSGRRNFTYGDEIWFRVDWSGSPSNVRLYWRELDANGEPIEASGADIEEEHDGWSWCWVPEVMNTYVRVYAEVSFADGNEPLRTDMDLWIRSRGEAPMPGVGCPDWIFDNADGLTVAVFDVQENVQYRLSLMATDSDPWTEVWKMDAWSAEAKEWQVPHDLIPVGNYQLVMVYEYADQTGDFAGFETGEWTWDMYVTHEHQPIFIWPSEHDGETLPAVTFQKVCMHCGDEQLAEPAAAEVEEIDRAEVSCDYPAWVQYRAHIHLNEEEDYEEDKTYALGEALGHQFGNEWFEWDAPDPGHVSVDFVRNCDRCGWEQRIQADAELLADQVKEPTCEETGEYPFRASVTPEGENERTDTFTVYVDPLGHDWSEWTTVRAATCEHTGYQTSVCRRDEEHTRFRNLEKLGHDWRYTYTYDPEAGLFTATRICGNDDPAHPTHMETETAGVEERNLIQAPTETTAGSMEMKSFGFENPNFEICSETVVIPALKDMNVLRLPAGLTEIEEEAFSGAICQAIIVPAGCGHIGPRAFAGCGNLLYVKLENAATIWEEDAFADCPRMVMDIPNP